MNIKEQIRAEIRRQLSAHDKVDHLEAQEVGKAWNRGHRKALENLLSFIDTIPEQPARDFCKENCKGFQETGRCFSDEPCVAKQSVEGLEEEIATWIPAHISGGDDEVWKDTKKVVIEWAGIVARHFAEWGFNTRKEDK